MKATELQRCTLPDDFARAYLECALWATNDQATPSGGEPLDRNHTVDDIAPESLARMLHDCARFQRENSADIAANPTQAGYDFWLTRNGHGAGFWDGDWPDAGDRLTAASDGFGGCGLYVGDDGMIYCN